MAKKMNETHSDAEIREAFSLFDKDSNGYITGDELKEIMAVLGEDLSDKEVEDMINTADSDADGRINYHGKCWKLSSYHWYSMCYLYGYCAQAYPE